jgi:hypothetical protein
MNHPAARPKTDAASAAAKANDASSRTGHGGWMNGYCD